MKLALAALAVVLIARAADAGRYCGSEETFAPGEGSTLPVGPTIAVHVEDAYFEATRQHRAVPTKLKITLAGKPVKFTTRDVRVTDGLIRYITIKSKDTGELVITSAKKKEEDELETFASYTIAESFAVPETPTAVVSRGADLRLHVYHQKGHFARVRVDVPAISYTLKWRANTKAKWKTLTLPASLQRDYRRSAKDEPTAGFSEARIGEGICGVVDTVPIAALQAGIEVELTATLPTGKRMKITDGLASPFVLPKKPATARPRYEDDPLGLDPE